MDEVVPAPVPRAPPASPPSRPPFSCQPLPGAFFFPSPGPDPLGRFTRCASFDVGAVKQLAVSPDGRLVALAPTDGIVRVVEVASRQVLAVLAPPRATIDFVAFEPSGRGILTLASGEREVTLWRALDWTPVWTVSLPGDRYQLRFGGGVAFAPDGRQAVVSPGDATYLLDVGSGMVRATRTGGAVLDVAYGWGGRRVVVAEASLLAHCVPHPNGGIVAVLDAATLGGVAQVADLGTYGSPGGGGIPAFRASPVDDSVLVVPRVDEPPGVHAFRLSDGSPLPAPGLATLPSAFMPDGASVLLNQDRALRRISLADRIRDREHDACRQRPASRLRRRQHGRFRRQRDATAPGLEHARRRARDGLRRRAADDARLPAAAGRDLPGRPGAGARGRHRYPGAPPRGRRANHHPADARLAGAVAQRPDPGDGADLPTPPALVSRAGDGARLAELPGDEWWWWTFAFSPGEDRLYSTGFRSGAYGATVVELGAPSETSPVSDVPAYSALIGTAYGCPVLYESGRGAWRRCGSCEDPPFLPGESASNGAVLSADGRFVAVRHGDDGVTVGEMPPVARKLATFRPRDGRSRLAATRVPDRHRVGRRAAAHGRVSREELLRGTAARGGASRDRDGQADRRAAAGSGRGRRRAAHARLRLAALVRALGASRRSRGL